MASAIACHIPSLLARRAAHTERKASILNQAFAAFPSQSSRQGTRCRRILQDRIAFPIYQAKVLKSRTGGEKERKTFQVTAAVQDVNQDDKVTLSKFGMFFAGTVAMALVGAAAGMYIDKFTDLPCMATQSCTPISDVMKTLLIGTHLYNFMLLPATMFVMYDRLPSLVKGQVRSPFTMSLGVAYMMVSMAGEIGWHVTQEWYYHDEYMVLNLIFYVFLNLGLALWAWGIKIEEPGTEDSALSKGVDVFLLSTPLLTVLFYLLGAEVTDTKLPIFITMSLIFVALTYRYYQLLRTWAVLGFPFFSVGVNLFFISKLNEFGSDPFLNPLYHILHDACGTMLGLGYIAVLTYITPIRSSIEKEISDE